MCQRAHRHPCQSARNPFIVAQARGLPLVPFRLQNPSSSAEDALEEVPHRAKRILRRLRGCWIWRGLPCRTGCRALGLAASHSICCHRLGQAIRPSIGTQRRRNLRVDSPRRSLRNCRRSQPCTYRGREGMLLLRLRYSPSGRRRIQQRVCNRYRLLCRTPARRTLMIHYLFQTTVFKQHMLPSLQLIRRFAKLVSNIQHRRLLPTILNACIAVSRNAKLQVKRSIAPHRESKVRRRYHIATGRGHLHLNRPAIECQHQRSRRRSIRAPARHHMQPAGRTHAHRAATAQFNLRSTDLRRNRSIYNEDRSSVAHLERTRHCRILHSNGADRLLRLRQQRSSEEKRELTNLKYLRLHSVLDIACLSARLAPMNHSLRYV